MKLKKEIPITNWLWWIPPLILMYIIFQFSAANAAQSSALSDGISAQIILKIDQIFSFGWPSAKQAVYAESLHIVVRKTAHFLEYTLLSFLLVQSFRKTVCSVKKHAFFFAWLFATLYAATDEIHQLFVPGRSGMVRDVLLDSTGAAFGIAIFALVTVLLFPYFHSRLSTSSR